MARIRTFLAIDLGPAIRKRLASLQKELSNDAPDVNWVEGENLHITLLFLGDIDERESITVCRAAQQVTSSLPTFQVTMEGVGCFPNTRRPRVVWVGVSEGADNLVKLHHELESKLEALGLYRPEMRAYKPHVTLGRIKGEGPHDALVQALAKQQEWAGGEANVREVLVMSSEMTRDGPTYTILGRAKLTGEA